MYNVLKHYKDTNVMERNCMENKSQLMIQLSWNLFNLFNKRNKFKSCLRAHRNRIKMSSNKKKEVYTRIHEVTPLKQRFDWDCGLTCVMMLLSEDQRSEFQDNFHIICDEEGFGQSTWTIDLCYLLKRFGIKHELYTTMVGVNEEHRNNSYYHRIFDTDRTRIQDKFRHAASHDIPVFEQQITPARIVEHLTVSGPVILLVDSGMLVCDTCPHNRIMAEFRRCFPSPYQGHYILLMGLQGSRVLYREPARMTDKPCAATLRRLMQAAAVTGTDDDCILVYR